MKQIFIFLLLASSLKGFAQYEFAPLTSDTKWSGYSQHSHQYPFIWWIEYKTNSQNSDTIINNTVYSKLYRNNLYHCAFKSDTINKTVYVIPKDSLVEDLFFDFDANYSLNDTVSLLFYYKTNQTWVRDSGVVESISTVTYNGQLYNSYNFTSFYNYQPYINITERLLSTSFPFSISDEFETIYKRKCYSEYDSIFDGISCPFTFNDFNLLLGLDSDSESQNLQVYPNPSNGMFTLQNNDDRQLEVDIYSVTGQVILKQIIEAKASISITNQLPAGLYFIKSNNPKVLQIQTIIVND